MSSTPRILPLERPTLLRPRGVQARSLGRALIVIVALALLLGVMQLGIAILYSELVWAVMIFTAVFWTWLTAGVIAWWRRPDNGIGPLIVLGGFALYLGGLANIPLPLFEFLAGIFATSVLAVTVHTLHAFPSGRLRGRVSSATVVLVYFATIGFDTAMMLVPTDAESAQATLLLAQQMLGIGAMAVTAVVLARRLIVADPPHRRVLLPMFAYGILVVVIVPLVPLVLDPLGVHPFVGGVTQLILIAGLPIAFLLGVLLGSFSRTSPFEALSAWLAQGAADRPAAAHALATALGDETLRVFYRVVERDVFVDETGAVRVDEGDDTGRGWIDVRVDDRLVGAIEYDERMIGDPEGVRRAGEVLAIAIDRERLTAELRAMNAELVSSRLRLVEAAYLERSRIARDLHDGLQVQLVLLALEAQTIANSVDPASATSEACAQLRRGIDAAAADLRHLVHNVLPAGLLEQGLTAAAEDLADRLEMPATLDADIDEETLSRATAHTAYFVLAELLANAVKHSRADSVEVTLSQHGGRLLMNVADDGIGGARVAVGAGLRGLIDRVSAIEGEISIDSPPGAGTKVKVDLPCE